MKKISVVINTFNEEKNIRKAILSVAWADEIVVCDMQSVDETVKIAKSLGAKVVSYKQVNFVEPARNFAISSATREWILILDADEQVPETLVTRLKELVKKNISASYVEIPRKNIIFTKWILHTGWWPDYQIRFFKKGTVTWNNQIHNRPQTKGDGLKLEAEGKWAIIHSNYASIGEYIERLNRYSKIQAEEILKSGYKFKMQDLFEKPVSEFLSRYFASQGYQDGLHGLVLSLLQAFSFLIVYLKIWEKAGFTEQTLILSEFEKGTKIVSKDINYWLNQSKGGSLKQFLKIFKK